MTDLMFLLLLFLLIATTLINPNALKLMLPKSSNMLKDKAVTTVSIQDTGHGKYRYYVELQDVGSVEGVERALKSRLDGQKEFRQNSEHIQIVSKTDKELAEAVPIDL